MRTETMIVLTLSACIVILMVGMAAYMLAPHGADNGNDTGRIDLEEAYLGSQDGYAYFAVYPDTKDGMQRNLSEIVTKGGVIREIEMPRDNVVGGAYGIIVWTLCEIPESE